MKKYLQKNMWVLIAAITVSFSMTAQEQIVLNRSDYSIPSWTKLLQMSNVKDVSVPHSINMTINGDPSSRMAFSWFTTRTATLGKVQIVKKIGAIEKDFLDPLFEKEALVENISLNYLVDANRVNVGISSKTNMDYTSHKVLIDNLESGTTYSFRVGADNAWSSIGSFTTAKTDKSGYSFIYITDTQAQHAEMFDVSQKTIHAAQRLVPNANFMLCNGDFVETTGATKAADVAKNFSSEWEWEQWFSSMQDVWMRTPLVPALGNHDRSFRDSNFAKHFNTDNSFNVNAGAAGTSMDGTVYSFVQGDALFMVVNYEDYSASGYFDALKNWMREQVKSHSDVKWRIMTYHKNMFTGSSSHQDDSDAKIVREAMLPLFDELNIDLALQGHDHIYEVIGPVSNATKTLIPGAVQHVEIVGQPGARANMTGKQGGVFNVSEGTLYFLNNSAGKKKYEPRDETAMIAAKGKHGVENYWGLFSGKFGQTGEPTFSKVNVTTDTISIETYTVDDLGQPTLFDSFSVVKNDKGSSDPISESNSILVIPNPVTNICRVEGINANKIEIFSVKGDLIVAVENSNSIDLSALFTGTYVAKITSENGFYFSNIVKK